MKLMKALETMKKNNGKVTQEINESSKKELLNSKNIKGLSIALANYLF